VEAVNAQSFIAELSEICRRSSDLPWQPVLQQALALFAKTAHTQNVALLLLDEGCTPVYCIQHQQTEIQVLCVALQKYASRWQRDLTQRGTHTLTIHELITPMWLLPIPPNAENPKALLAFTDVVGTFPQALLEQGGALLTPLIHSALLQYERDNTRTRRPIDSAITRQQRQRQTYLESLYTLISTINTATNLNDILTTGLNQAMQIADMVQGKIYLLDKRDQVLKLSVCLPPDEIDQGVTFLPGEGGPGRALVQKWMVVEHDPPVSVAAGDLDVSEPQSHVNLPLIVEGKAVGVMRLSTLNKQTLSLEVTQLLVTIADQLALTLQRGQLADQMQDQLQIMRRLYEITTAFLSQTGSHGTIFLLLRALHDNITESIGTAFYRFENSQWVRSQFYPTTNSVFKTHWGEGPVWESEASFLATTQQEHMLVLTEAQRAEFPSLWEHVAAVDARQILYLPLFSPDDDCSGIVAVLMAEEHALDENETIMAWAIVQQGMAALVRINLYEATQKSESLMRAILESSRDGIILVGFDATQPTIRYINGQALCMFALPEDATRWERRALPKIIAAATPNAPELMEWLAEAAVQAQSITENGEKHEEEGTAATDDQSAPVFETARGLMLQVQRWDVYAEQNQSLGALFLFRDVTEAKALERMREDLLNMLVHDMRNPLSAAQHALHLLQDPDMQDVTNELINIAFTSTERLTKLVETILEISRLESGRFELQQQALILADHVDEIVKNTFVSSHNINVDVDVPYTLPFLWVDAAAVTRVFENLFNNALKFVPRSGDGRIRVAAIQEGDWVQIEVYNNGPHIPPETQQMLFTKFVAGQYQGRGYGLGLAFCRLVVEAHGGKIWIRNQPEGGVSFYFTLPTWEDPDADLGWD
jgi:signal transduction histidine kinase